MSENQSILVKLLKSIFNLFGSSSDSSSQNSNQKTGNISQFSHCFNSFSELALDVIIEDIDESVLYVKGDVMVNDWEAWLRKAATDYGEFVGVLIDGNLTITGEAKLHILVMVTGNVQADKIIIEDQSFAVGGDVNVTAYLSIKGTSGPHIDINGKTNAPYILVQNQVSINLTPTSESLLFKVSEINREFADCFIDDIRGESGEDAMKYFYVEMNPILRKLNEGVYPFTKPRDEMLALLKAHPSYQSGLLSDNHESFYKD